MINKEAIILSVRRVSTDRPFMVLIATVIMAMIVYLAVVGLNIHVSDVTIYNRYTAFGEAHFYKDHWQYLLGFVGFGLIAGLIHISLMIKFHNLERRQTAIMIGWLGVLLLLIAMLYALAVMQLGRSL